MKRSQVAVAAFSMLFGLGVAVVPNHDVSFRGEIMDSYCADVGSHETLTKSPQTARDCTIGCVKTGAKYVLYSPNRNKAFRLDDQRTPALFAGERVRVVGTYNKETNTIHVDTIQPALPASLKEITSVVKAYFRR